MIRGLARFGLIALVSAALPHLALETLARLSPVVGDTQSWNFACALCMLVGGLIVLSGEGRRP